MSNRLTFSLASLILIFTLGVVAMPAIAGVESIMISSTPTSGYYSSTDGSNDITIVVTFASGDAPFIGSGSPVAGDAWVNFSIGGQAKMADDLAPSASGDTITFSYSVADGDDGAVAIGANALKLKSGVTLKQTDAAGAAIPITHPASVVNIDTTVHKVDTTAPKVTNVAFDDPGPYGVDADIVVIVTYSEPVTAPAALTGLTLILDTDGTTSPITRTMDLQVPYLNVNSLKFAYTVVAGDKDDDGVELPLNPTSASIYTNSIVDKASNPIDATGARLETKVGGMVDTTVPAFAATDPIDIVTNGPYSTGDAITVVITYNEDVIVTGTPILDISIGGTPQIARNEASSDPMKVVFSYIVTAADSGDVTIGASAIRLPGTSSITDAAGNDAPLNNAAVGTMTGQTVAQNSAPVFTDGAPATRSVAENTAADTAIGTPVTATDADGDTLTYTLGGTNAASFAIVSTSGQLQTSAALDYETKNSYMVTVTADDGNGGTASIDVTINVTDVDETPPTPVNTAPTLSITTTPPTTAVTTGSFSIAYSAMDADAGDTVTVSAVIKSVNPPAAMANYSVAPPADGMVVITQAAPTATTMTTPGATVTVTLTANDGTVDSAPMDFTVSFAPLTYTAPNMDPVFDTGLPATITGKSLVPITSVTFSATDADGGTLAYSWDVDETALGLMLDKATGTVSGTPKKAHSGSHPITVMDGQGGSATHPLMVTISGNTAPAFSVDTFAFPTLTAGMAHPVTLPGASDADMDTLAYSIRGALPAGLAASADGSKPLEISGAATAAGTTAVAYVVSDGRGGEDTLALTITVNAAAPTPPGPPATPMPSFATGAGIAVPALTVGTAMTPVTLPLASGGVGEIKHSLRVGLKDVTASGYNGLMLDAANVQLMGTPLAADATGTVFTWRATDANNNFVDLTFTVVVKPKQTEPPEPDPPTVITVAPKSTNLDRVGTFDADFKVAPNQGAFELTVTHKDPRSLIGIWDEGVDIDRRNVSFRQNTGTPTSWTLRIAISNPNPVRSRSIVVYSRNSSLYRLATPSASDPTKNVNIDSLRVQIDNEGPRVLAISEYELIPAGGGPFEVSILFDEPLKATPVADNFTITNGSISDIRLLSGANQYGHQRYLARITPNHGVGPKAAVGKRNVDIRLNSNLADKYDNMSLGTAADAVADASFVIKKATTAPTPDPTPAPVGTVIATLSADGTKTTITEGRIAANGFAVIQYTLNPTLPDLEYFFDIGGSITLHDNDTADDKNSRTVVISEILWGLDLGELVVANQPKHQFIELYNTTDTEINLEDWTLTFTEGNVRPAIDIDQVSNRGPGGWEVDTGDTGKSGRVTGTVATDATSTITPVDIVSMYRNINYNHVVAQVANRGELVKGIPGGNAKGSWKNSTRRSDNRWIKSTPGERHHTTTGILVASAVSGTPFRINEIGNDTDGANDWVELYNHSDAAQSLKNYQLTMVTAQGTDTELFDFTGDVWDNRKIPAKGYLVISTRHPRDTDLAAGKDITIADDQEENRGASHLFVVKSGWNLQDDGKFALILRGRHGDAHKSQGTGNHLVDVVATRQGSFAHTNTSLWPLAVTGLPHENVIDGGDENFAAGKVYQRNSGNGRGEKQFAVRGSTGIGYDRAAEASAANGGTPGYDNAAVKEKIADLSNAEVSFSEIMLGLGDSRQNLPQWIEIYNSSMTQAAITNGWKLHVENTADVATALDAVLNLDGIIIPPNQTVLIVTNTGRVSDPDHFPSNRVVNLWTTKKHRDALEMVRRTDQVFSTTGLYLKLTDKDNKLVDEFGNLDGNRRTRDELDKTWKIPMNGADDERRSSLIRVYDAGVPIKGTMAEAWVLADETNLAFAISETYYGDPDDYGTPGFRAGGPLPVSLSKFRPVRLDDGSVRIVWITESELNNAGFNILRSEKRDGEYKQINTKLIAGQGTTSERTTYTHVDTSAKPNVVYYYQIQDVSHDGKVQTLRLSRLKGNVSAEGKLTTTWGELKALQ